MTERSLIRALVPVAVLVWFVPPAAVRAAPGEGAIAAFQAAGTAPSPQQGALPEPSPQELRRRVLEVEDARDTSSDGLEAIATALKSKDTETRRVAVRALGRLERPTLAARIAPILLDPAPAVRAEASNALAQVTTAEGGDVALAADLLHGQLERETHPIVRGALAHALGRLPYRSAEDARRAERALVAVARGVGLDRPDPARSERDIPAERTQFAPPSTLLNALRGFEPLARLQATLGPPEAPTLTLLKELGMAWRSAVARAEGGPTAEAAARIRRLALAALVAARAVDHVTVSTAFGDADDQVRRLAAHGAALLDPLDPKLLERAVRDTSPLVRAALLLALTRDVPPPACGYATILFRDPDVRVAGTALDLAAKACAGQPASIAAVASLAGRLPPEALTPADAVAAAAGRRPGQFGLFSRTARQPLWHAASHALVALAQLAPEQLEPRLAKHVADPRWPVRMYAARAATAAKLDAPLLALANDAHDNVREAAITGLQRVKGHAADEAYLAALSRSDGQLLIAAARALEGTPRREDAARALQGALERVSGERRETSRDARLALLDRLAEVGGTALDPAVRPLTKDFDPRIANRASEILAGWGAAPAPPAPQPLPPAPLPSASELESLGTLRIGVTVRDVGRFEVRVLANEAPLNAWRFVRLARARFYDGLTIHRVVPDFVVQGGSPAANEYAGDAPFTRDEVGLPSNVRGSLGVSTRGRDTGDGQVYINLVDNPRLDHAYTVFGQIERGIEVIDALLEGDVIERVDVGLAERASGETPPRGRSTYFSCCLAMRSRISPSRFSSSP